jgi:hypothetical protein
MVFRKSPGGPPPAGFLPDVTSTRSFSPPDMDQAFGEIAVAQIKGWME